MLDRTGELALLPLDDDEAEELLAPISDDARGQCWWLVLRDRTPVRGDGGGGLALLLELRLTRPLGRALRAVRAFAVIDTLDELLSGQRARLGRLVPEGPAPRRYP